MTTRTHINDLFHVDVAGEYSFAAVPIYRQITVNGERFVTNRFVAIRRDLVKTSGWRRVIWPNEFDWPSTPTGRTPDHPYDARLLLPLLRAGFTLDVAADDPRGDMRALLLFGGEVVGYAMGLREDAEYALSPADSLRVAKALVHSARLARENGLPHVEADEAAAVHVNDLYSPEPEPEVVTPRELDEQAPAVITEPMRVGEWEPVVPSALGRVLRKLTGRKAVA